MVNLRSSVQKSNLQLVSTFYHWYQSKRFEKHKLPHLSMTPKKSWFSRGFTHTRWCPSSWAKLGWTKNSNFTMVYGRYNELVFMGFLLTNKHHVLGHHLVAGTSVPLCLLIFWDSSTHYDHHPEGYQLLDPPWPTAHRIPWWGLPDIVNIQKTMENHHFSWENSLFRLGRFQ